MEASDRAGHQSQAQNAPDAIQPYTMHVSARYLELTRKKLELTRLPRELSANKPDWTNGTPKGVLEPLLDYWLEQYDWRAQEAALNNHLPQFRYHLNPLDSTNNNDNANAEGTKTSTPQRRLHFVHKRCQKGQAIPLLFCHGWPGSFLEVSKIINSLTEPYLAATSADSEAPLGFHVVAPSIPGFGFSDAPAEVKFGLEETAEYFNTLMKELGYETYVAHGSGLGFAICRMLSLKHGSNCCAIHTISPRFPAPQFRHSYTAALQYRFAHLTNARYGRLAFGYTPSELVSTSRPQGLDAAANHEEYAARPQTRSYALTDSPAALLGVVLDILQPLGLDIPPKPPQQHRSRMIPSTSSSRSSSMDNVRRTTADPFMEPIRESMESGLSLLQLAQATAPAWTPSDVLDWTMMMWLPGAEGGLRWLSQVVQESVIDPTSPLWKVYSTTPLGISTFNVPSLPETLPIDQPPPASESQTPTESSWWNKLSPWFKWFPTPSGRPQQPGASAKTVISSSPPSWATAYQRVEWVRRHQTHARLPVWELADQVVDDLRDCFGRMQERGLIKLPDV